MLTFVRNVNGATAIVYGLIAAGITAALTGCTVTHREPDGGYSYTSVRAPALEVHDGVLDLAEGALEDPPTGGATITTSTRQGSTTVVVGPEWPGMWVGGYAPGYVGGRYALDTRGVYQSQIDAADAAATRFWQDAAAAQVPHGYVPSGARASPAGSVLTSGGGKVPCPKDRRPSTEAERLTCNEEAIRALTRAVGR